MLDWLIDNAYLLLFAFIALPTAWVAKAYFRQMMVKANRSHDFQRITEQHGFEFLGNARGFVDLIQTHLANSVLANLNESQSDLKKLFNKMQELLEGELPPERFFVTSRNVAHRELSHGHCFLFDLSKTSLTTARVNRSYGSEGNSDHFHSRERTVIFGHFEAGKFPAAIIRPKSLKQRLVRAIQRDAIELDGGASQLHEKYYLLGKDLPHLSEFLTDRLVDAICAKTNYEIEFWGSVFLVTLDLETGNSFKVGVDPFDDRIGINHLKHLEEFTKSTLAMMRIVDEAIPD